MINDTLKSSTAETVQQRCGVKLLGGRKRRGKKVNRERERKRERERERERGREV